MGHANGRITAPVNTDDVRLTIGEPSDDVGTLCTSDRINPAAIYRPRYSRSNPGLQLNAAGFTEIAGNISQAPGNGYVCPAYGVWVPEYNLRNIGATGYSDLFALARKTWHIAAPDSNSFYILDHFAGYRHDARVTPPIISAAVTKRAGGGVILSMVLTTPAPDGATLSVSNLFGGKGLYFAAIVLRGTNLEAWTPQDTMIVAGTSTPVSATASTTVSVKIEDPDADMTEDYAYRIIPFVVNKANVTASTLSGTTCYGLRIDGSCKDYMEVKTGVSGEAVEGQFTLHWNDPQSNGEYYPDPLDSVKLPTSVHPDAAVVMESAWYRTDSDFKGLDRLYKVYDRIDFEFTLYDSSGHREMLVHTWTRNGDGSATRDTRYDNTGGWEDRMMFYMSGLNPANVDDLLVRLYYTRSDGRTYRDDHFAIYIPPKDN